MFTFTPLLGAQSTSAASQSLLELDGGVKILIDVGWDESFDAEKLKELEKQIPTLSIVLLTHATTAHLAAFAHCCKHFPLFTRIPVYATSPVIALGRTLLQDLYASTPLASSVIPQSALAESAYSYSSTRNGDGPKILLQRPSVEEIAVYFNRIHPLKYLQPHQPIPSSFSPPLNGLTITAYSAGHTLGGTIWHIQHGLESIVYAVDWNQAREHVLSGAAWLAGAGGGGAEVIEHLRHPTALICSSKGAERVALTGGRKRRDDLLLDLIKDTVAKGGTVLIPSDSSARILELAYLLETTWQKEPSDTPHETSLRRNAKLFLATRTSGATVRLARSMLEWMDPSIIRELEAVDIEATKTRKGGGSGRPEEKTPFDLAFVKLLARESQLAKHLSRDGPKVIIASDNSLEWGMAKDVLLKIATDERNLVILTERTNQAAPNKTGLGRYLWDLWEERNKALSGENGAEAVSAVEANGVDFTSDTPTTQPLEGNEMSLYQQYQAQQRQLQNTLQPEQGTAVEAAVDAVDDRSSVSSSSSEDSDVEHQGKIMTADLSRSRHKLGLTDAELGINILLRQKGVHDYDVRGKKGREKMFPFVAKRRRNDDFGEAIRPDEFLRAEEREEADGQDAYGETAKLNTVGQKRKWDDAGTNGVDGRRLNGAGKRLRSGDEISSRLRDTVSPEADESSEDEEEEQAAPEGPVKLVPASTTIRLNLRIAFVDFAGLHDKRSLQMIIPLIRPRKLILIGGEEGETLALAEDCRQLLGTGEGSKQGAIDVFTPLVGITIDASVDTNAWTVKLSRDLVKKLQWQNVRGLGVVAISARLEAVREKDDKEETARRKKMKMIKGEDESMADDSNENADANAKTVPILSVIPASMATATRTVAQPLHVGDLRLADLRKLMQAAGYTAEFRGEGTLFIDGNIAVRKSGPGRIEVENVVVSGQTAKQRAAFYEVRKKIYEGLAVVAGG
ncbi:hypothetical protein K402DRAFT_360819 [Aulographum hederae CBS 113979]|uniref:Cleavage and polyadenylation specificity factor subunit 2 n=1 Tax=Aulographum hederae CBS 113979 TaxID=1176131 RepID=A0A6G1GR85_9PEZI|nr:hypothetical protein K402DRAFT_360819 [Aulographum hederae CBS 113979]